MILRIYGTAMIHQQTCPKNKLAIGGRDSSKPAQDKKILNRLAARHFALFSLVPYLNAVLVTPRFVVLTAYTKGPGL